MHLRVDTAELRRACADLRVPEPPVTLSDLDKGKTLGEYCAIDGITIFAGTTQPSGTLRETLHQINDTFLHELRHHYQRLHWDGAFTDKPGAYYTTRHETDARDWAGQNVSKYRVIKIAPRKVHSNLSRLSRAEQAHRR